VSKIVEPTRPNYINFYPKEALKTNPTRPRPIVTQMFNLVKSVS